MQFGRFAVGPSSGATSLRAAQGGHFRLGATGSKPFLRLPNPSTGERSHVFPPSNGSMTSLGNGVGNRYSGRPDPRTAIPVSQAKMRRDTDMQQLDPTEIGKLGLCAVPSGAAIIGASTDPLKFGGRALKSCLERNFRGRLHPVNARNDIVQSVAADRNFPKLPTSQSSPSRHRRGGRVSPRRAKRLRGRPWSTVPGSPRPVPWEERVRTSCWQLPAPAACAGSGPIAWASCRWLRVSSPVPLRRRSTMEAGAGPASVRFPLPARRVPSAYRSSHSSGTAALDFATGSRSATTPLSTWPTPSRISPAMPERERSRSTWRMPAEA